MKKIPLTQGKFALVDDEDYEYLVQWTWWITTNGYAETQTGGRKNRKSILMHRVINKTPPGMATDHIDANKLNNQKGNLRNATGSQNGANRKKYAGKSSKYKGVYKVKGKRIWVAYICPGRKKIHLGCFKVERSAAIAHDEAAIKHFGEFALLNFK